MRNLNDHSPQLTEQDTKIAALEEELLCLKAIIARYEEMFRLQKQRQFGASSEKFPSGQLTLFGEETSHSSTLENTTVQGTSKAYNQKKKKRKVRESLNNELPVTVVHHSLPLKEQACSDCGHSMHVMKKEIRREIKIIPARAEIVQHERDVFSCRTCEKENTHTPIVRASMPEAVIPKSMASPSAIAYVVTQRYMYATPLHRLEAQFRQLGVNLSRQTMSNWLVLSTEELLRPLYSAMHQFILSLPVLHADESTQQVLYEEGKQPSSKSYIWLYRTGRIGPPCAIYVYSSTRSATNPKLFLENFKGTLHTDGYSGYEGLENVSLSGCWAHLRRYFDKAVKAAPKNKKEAPTLSELALMKIGEIYKIERKITSQSFAKRRKVRRKESLPLAEAFFAWLQSIQPIVTPKSQLGKAIKYGINQKEKLLRPFLDGILDIDNNRAERSIRPFVLGRKNSLFSITPKGAQSTAILYSIVESAKENKLNVLAYLVHLYETLPNIDKNNVNELAKLFPWSKKLPEQCYLSKN
ncbi:IS66 family transposase [Sporosarcina saromensis]|nr:IS66 family transposase [Sporosarcina saromensis]